MVKDKNWGITFIISNTIWLYVYNRLVKKMYRWYNVSTVQYYWYYTSYIEKESHMETLNQL